MEKKQIPGVIVGKIMNMGGMLQRQSNKMLQPYKLNHQQFAIFFEITKAGKVKQKEMVNRLLLEKSHVSKVVKKLHKMGLIAISETEDRRSFWLAPTEQGEEVVAQCSKMFGEWHKEWIGDIEDDDLLTIVSCLTKLQSAFKNNSM